MSDLINKKNYFDFLSSKGDDCIIKTYKKLYDLGLKENYPPANSNKQIKFLVELIYKNKNINYFNNLLTLFSNFISFNDSFKLIEKIHKNKKDLSDTEIIKIVEKFRKVSNGNSTYSVGEECSKTKFGMDFLKKQMKPIDYSNFKYLDVGCGDGRKTIQFAQTFKIKKDNIYGADIEAWGPYAKDKTSLPFQFKGIKNDKLDYPDNQFDIITCFLTLHHVKNMEKLINEIYRVLKEGGILILIEHDALNYYDKLLIEIQHTFFAYLYDKNKEYIKHPDYSNYLNNMEFQYIFTKLHKFTLGKSGNFVQSIDMQKRYDQQFYQIYYKIKKK
jgi:ubiquinone/menaquinone biosynthesis C-methylase UbiE